MNDKLCPRCRKGHVENLICDECHIDLRTYQYALSTEKTMIAKPKVDGPEVCQRILHWLLGSKPMEKTRAVWLIGDYRNEFIVATAAMGLWHHLHDRLRADGISTADWLRQFKDVEKTVWLLALPLDPGHPDDPDATFDILLRDWAVTALIAWSKSPEALQLYRGRATEREHAEKAEDDGSKKN